MRGERSRDCGNDSLQDPAGGVEVSFVSASAQTKERYDGLVGGEASRYHGIELECAMEIDD